ncbi:Gfo/Idh/MocA family protein [Pelagicoccus mobilis]|uniref:Gfo/Idh/MocA family oxidoreductase n=1 Tax=Pelagicoccus mobilis TaxID=415221 RepID=A0A934RRY0_9BACT|nr:Gfo/Idh/MocA family oxidoreductase [Pelagicoccus mobilis]MBK1876475.1 Gfo/Idh/MocA family oxidoreductase [Pelagicoccus mobilis]
MAKDTPNVNRRSFIKSAAGASALGLVSFPHIMSAQAGKPSANDKLNIAFVGVGGKGVSSIVPISRLGHNIIALCDVDQKRVQDSKKKRDGEEFMRVIEDAATRGAKWYKDYRKMFEELGDKMDGVVISTPDHMHFPIALSAVNLGINVYCEKPLTHTVEEARILAKAARKKGVVTQMGNQGHSNEGVRLAKEWIAAGALGQIHEVYSWTNRPVWPQGLKKPDHSKGAPDVPKDLDWDLWLGIADKRAYDPAYMPFKWRAWWDFGCGAVGDMACHVMDAAFYSLNLGLPDSVEALATSVNDHCAPNASAITYKFPKRGKFDPVTYHWLDGGMLPPAPKGLPHELLTKRDNSGTLFIGEEGYLLADTYTKSIRVFPDERFDEIKKNRPPKTIKRIKGTHQGDWLNAISTGGQACSHWDYASELTELGLLGNVAIRSKAKIKYDAKKMKVTNIPEANKFLKKEYPDGWILS